VVVLIHHARDVTYAAGPPKDLAALVTPLPFLCVDFVAGAPGFGRS
jgi:hypothetical protein